MKAQMKQPPKERILFYKILYTVLIMILYIACRTIPLYGVDTSAYNALEVDAESVVIQNMTGDFSGCSLFTLGLWPYMWGSMGVSLYALVKSMDSTSRLSPKTMNRMIYGITLTIGVAEAVMKASEYTYTVPESEVPLAQVLVVAEMLAGMMYLLWLCGRTEKYGVGGRTAIFLVNIMNGITTMLAGHTAEKLWLPLLLGVLYIPVMLVLERSEKRIPVQRVSIHSIYADKNYIPYKLNPAGIMPVMFTSAFYMLLQMLIRLPEKLFPGAQELVRLEENMQLTTPFGVGVYLAVQTLLIIVFAFMMLTPSRTAETLMKSGDSLEDIYAGRPTMRYLRRSILQLALVSAAVLAVCMGVPLFLQFADVGIDRTMAMLPSSVMMLTGLCLTLNRELTVYRQLEAYRPLV